MKTIVLLFLFFISVDAFAQKQINFTTTEIVSISEKYGPDSALKLFTPFSDIYLIDPAAALRIGLLCKDPGRYSVYQSEYYSNTGIKIKNRALLDIAIQNIQDCRYNFLQKPEDRIMSFSIPSSLFDIIVFQNDSSIVPVLKDEFEFWEQKADSIRLGSSSSKKLSRQLYTECKENSFMLAATLHHLNTAGFTKMDLQRIGKSVSRFSKDDYPEKSRSNHTILLPQVDTVNLSRTYSSIADIDFEHEPGLEKFVFIVKDSIHCWQKLITHDNLALYETGCSYGRENGRGQTLRIKLLSPSLITIELIESWIS